MHPCHKLEYFKTAGWHTDWIATARQLVTNVYKSSYSAHHGSGMNDSNDTETTQEQNPVSANIFNNLPCMAKPQPKAMCNKLEAYLASGVENIKDALQWWYSN